MAKRNIHTVTHPDGTISKRTSESRVYTHTVVVRRSRESLVADMEATVDSYEGLVAAAEAAIGGEVTETSRDWSGNRRYITLYLSGYYAGAYVSDQERPTDEQLRETMRERIEQNRRLAENARQKQRELAAGPDAEYGVVRWSSRADLAHSAATGEYGRLVRPGVSVTVVPVD